MKKVILLFALISISFHGNSQIDSTIYGISWNVSGPGISISKINPQTGLVTNVSTTPANYDFYMTGRTIDPVHKIFYLPSDTLLLSFNLLNGNLINAIPINYYPGSTSFLGINYNTMDSTIYGLIQTFKGVILTKIDPLTGIVDRISPDTVPGQYSSLAFSAIDPVGNIFYYVSTNKHITGINLSTGNAVTSPAVVIPYGTFGPIVYNCQDETVYGLAGDGVTGRKLAKIDVTTGVVTMISPSIISSYIYGEPPTIDPYKGIYYFDRADSALVGASVVTGEIVTSPKKILIPGTYFQDLIYNFPCYILPSGIDNPQSSLKIDLFPNPAQTFMTIRFLQAHNGMKSIEIFDMRGVKMFQGQTKDDNITINLKDYPKGLYTIRLGTATSNYTSRFCKTD